MHLLISAARVDDAPDGDGSGDCCDPERDPSKSTRLSWVAAGGSAAVKNGGVPNLAVGGRRSRSSTSPAAVARFGPEWSAMSRLISRCL